MAILQIFQILSSEWPTTLSLLIFMYVIHYYIRYFKRENALPGLFPLPIIGNLHQMDRDITVFFDKVQKKYGDICEIYVGNDKIIILSRADLLEQMFSNGGNLGKAFPTHFPPNEGLDEVGFSNKGIFFNKSDEWKFNRKFLSQTMMSPRFLKEFVSVSQEVFDEIEKYWNILLEDEVTKELEFTQWLTAYTTDTTFYYTTGNRVYSLAIYFNSLIKDEQKKTKHPKSILQESKDYVDSLRMLSKGTMFFLMVPRLIRHYVPIISRYNQLFLDNAKWFENKNLEFINEREELVKNTKNHEELSPNTLTLLLTTNTEKDLNKITKGEFSRALSNKEIAASLMEIFTAGIESVRNLSEKEIFKKKIFLIINNNKDFFFF